MAVNERYKTKSGEWKEQTTFVDVVAWGHQAEVCGELLSKGSAVLVEGRLQLDEWESKKDGGKRSKLRVRASRVQSLEDSKYSEKGETHSD
jgi:single-strand DNA-binding protein